MASNRSALHVVNRVGIPLIAAAMIFSTGVAVVLAACRILAYAGPERTEAAARDIFWIVFWTGFSEFIALAAGILIYRRLGQTIARLQNELTDLVRAVLHDLKTPVTHIRNAAEAALTGDRTAEDVLPDILESCGTLTDIINANAEISNTYGASDDRPPARIDLAAIARQCVELYEAIADDKGVRLSAEIPGESLPFAIHKGQFQHLANNLLDNAIKFTPAGGSVSLTLGRSAQGIVLTVSDTGCGIPADKLPHVFERFYRADFSRGMPGNGLGLALVEAIATVYRGSARAVSVPGKGSTFVIELPI